MKFMRQSSKINWINTIVVLALRNMYEIDDSLEIIKGDTIKRHLPTSSGTDSILRRHGKKMAYKASHPVVPWIADDFTRRTTHTRTQSPWGCDLFELGKYVRNVLALHGKIGIHSSAVARCGAMVLEARRGLPGKLCLWVSSMFASVSRNAKAGIRCAQAEWTISWEVGETVRRTWHGSRSVERKQSRNWFRGATAWRSI